MGGLEAPHQGETICFGNLLHRLESKELSRFQRRHLGFVFQFDNLIAYLTVEENIGIPSTLNGIAGKTRAHRIASLLEAVDLTDAAKALPHGLSGGETQRVSVARAVAHEPKLLLADEPTASLGSVTGREIIKLMRQLGTNIACTIIMATHDMENISLADSIVGLKDAKIE